MIRMFCGLALVALAACQPAIPDSAAGVGFNDYDTYRTDRARRDALLEGGGSAAAPAASGGEAGLSQADADRLAGRNGNLEFDDEGNVIPQRSRARISDENDFQAVSERQTIESDKARIERNRELYKVIEPTPIPQRSGASEPNVVDYALRTDNPVGRQLYERSVFTSESRSARNCARYASPDQAQIAFLEAGGPQRDKRGLDPDGDGYACGWNPAPFRAATRR